MVKITKFAFFFGIALFTLSGHAAEYFVNVGALSYDAEYLIGDSEIDSNSYSGSSMALSGGIRNLAGKKDNHAIGFGIDVYEIEDHRLIGLRAVDYQYQITRWMRAGAFLGAATLDSGLPQNGYYFGVSASLTEVIANTDILFEFRNGNGLARDTLLDDDPDGTKNDMFLDFVAASLALNWRF